MNTNEATRAHYDTILSLFRRDLLSYADARARIARTKPTEPGARFAALGALNAAHQARDAKRSAQGLL